MPNTAVSPTKYYPKLSTVVSIDEFPEILGFIKDGINNLLNKIHYKDLQFSKSPRGDAAFYSLSIVSPSKLEIEIPGTGISLILNPDLSGDNAISSFPITVEYEWKVLAFLREFSVGNFSFQPQEIFEMALRVLNITEEQALAQFINRFTEADDNTHSLTQFVVDLNDTFSWSIPMPDENTTLSEIVTSIYSFSDGKYASLVAYSMYILNNENPEVIWSKTKFFFKGLLTIDVNEYIKDILIPKFRATLTLIAAVEFPRNLLQPVYDENGVNPFNDSDSDPAKALT